MPLPALLHRFFGTRPVYLRSSLSLDHCRELCRQRARSRPVRWVGC